MIYWIDWWSSGIIVPCHGTDPGSILAQCIYPDVCISRCGNTLLPQIIFETTLEIERPQKVYYVSGSYFLVESDREGEV